MPIRDWKQALRPPAIPLDGRVTVDSCRCVRTTAHRVSGWLIVGGLPREPHPDLHRHSAAVHAPVHGLRPGVSPSWAAAPPATSGWVRPACSSAPCCSGCDGGRAAWRVRDRSDQLPSQSPRSPPVRRRFGVFANRSARSPSLDGRLARLNDRTVREPVSAPSRSATRRCTPAPRTLRFSRSCEGKFNSPSPSGSPIRAREEHQVVVASSKLTQHDARSATVRGHGLLEPSRSRPRRRPR